MLVCVQVSLGPRVERRCNPRFVEVEVLAVEFEQTRQFCLGCAKIVNPLERPALTVPADKARAPDSFLVPAPRLVLAFVEFGRKFAVNKTPVGEKLAVGGAEIHSSLPQCLHFRALALTDSEHVGQVFRPALAQTSRPARARATPIPIPTSPPSGFTW